MKPLDLRTRPPRGPRETMLGYYFVPRTIDKIRAELPGGNVGAYINDGPRKFSPWILEKMGVRIDEFCEVVERANDESDVEAWLRERVDPAAAPAVNAKFETFVVSRMSAEDRAFVREIHPVMAKRPELDRVLDILAADDEAAFEPAT